MATIGGFGSDPYRYSTTTTSGSAAAAGSPMYFSTTYSYDQREQAMRKTYDVAIEQEMLKNLEKKFFDQMEPRMWAKLQKEHDRQEVLVKKYDDIMRDRLPQKVTPEEYHMREAMLKAKKNMGYPAYKSAPARSSKIEHETTLERLWRKTDSWLSTLNTSLALQ
jgi:hypothetical protein